MEVEVRQMVFTANSHNDDTGAISAQQLHSGQQGRDNMIVYVGNLRQGSLEREDSMGMRKSKDSRSQEHEAILEAFTSHNNLGRTGPV